MKRKKISIALCTYNGARFLKKQLESIKNQTQQPEEIVVVDDCSKDNTIKVIQDFKNKSDLNIKIYQNQKNLGYVKNFEKAISLCNNDLVFLCDQDDIWASNKIEIVVNNFEGDVDLICHNSNLINEKGFFLDLTFWGAIAFDEFLSYYSKSEKSILKRIFIFGNVASGASMAFKKSKFNIKLDDSHPIAMAHDYQILLHFLMSGKVFFLNEPLMKYRLHKGQNIGLSIQNINKTKNEIQSFFKKEDELKYLLRINQAYKKLKIDIPQNELKAKILKFIKEWETDEKKRYFDEKLPLKSQKFLQWNLYWFKYKIYKALKYVIPIK